MYAPPGYVPRSIAFPTSPVSADAVLLMTGHVHPDFAGGGLGRCCCRASPRTSPGGGPGDRGLRRRAGGSGRPACCPPSTCGRSASRPCARTTATRGCGSS
jgi:hypothetical protein